MSLAHWSSSNPTILFGMDRFKEETANMLKRRVTPEKLVIL